MPDISLSRPAKRRLGQMAQTLAGDGHAPIRVRMLAMRIGHVLSLDGCPPPSDADALIAAYSERRETLRLSWRAYR
jgi:hypothetical protein